ncbi:DUF2252 domain-containing protein [Subtercola endophyticus]|uniref:DUF2252 domain-containing protein n=1 Tax=Subtercola endophyticus TaxID=2895559 RepID=UPI001E54B1BE|nr:DUF2252 domain-containing protein [Subtercola endophyticus]UFS60676.1 DUF2252 domain-containing protein [Subtercola endophyticus]
MTISQWNLDDREGRVSQVEAFARGKELRRHLPRREHANFVPSAERDPLGILSLQAESRVQELIPLRNERMLSSPFAFYRGTAGIMAADLGREANTGIRVVSCGDAHVSNFGLFASPQRTLVFDLNDFDEAAVAPWEWDVKRLVASVVIGARQSNFTDENVRLAARAAAKAYREGLNDMMKLSVLERYYFRIDTETPDSGLDSAAQKVLDKATQQARRRTSQAFVEKISERGEDGRLLIREDPPVLTHVPDATEELVLELFEQYKRTVPSDIVKLLSQFTLTDIAMRVVGVGSVGTRCYILILTGPQGEALVLQVKEAQVSVLQSFGGEHPGPNSQPRADPYNAAVDALQGRRVVANQHILQAVSDSFLGYLKYDGRDFYVRQFRDMKGSIDVSTLKLSPFITYSAACGTLLARAHAQSEGAAVIAGYLGTSDVFDQAVVDWSLAYATQSLDDFHAFEAAQS